MGDTQVHGGANKSKHKRKRLLIGLGVGLVVVVLGLAAGVGVRWWQQQQEYARQAKPEAVVKEVADAQNLALKGDYTKANEALTTALKNPNLSTQSKYDLLMQQGATYEGQKNPDAAMDTFRQAEAVQPTIGVAQAIARLAADKGDKQLAITYYKKALTLIPNDDSMRDEYKKYFESMISVLQGGQPTYE